MQFPDGATARDVWRPSRRRLLGLLALPRVPRHGRHPARGGDAGPVDCRRTDGRPGCPCPRGRRAARRWGGDRAGGRLGATDLRAAARGGRRGDAADPVHGRWLERHEQAAGTQTTTPTWLRAPGRCGAARPEAASLGPRTGSGRDERMGPRRSRSSARAPCVVRGGRSRSGRTATGGSRPVSVVKRPAGSSPRV
jgi:hypothetical protein